MDDSLSGMNTTRWEKKINGDTCVTAEGEKTVALTLMMMMVAAFIMGQGALPEK